MPSTLALLLRFVAVGALLCAGVVAHGALAYGERAFVLVPFVLGGYLTVTVAFMPSFFWLARPFARLRTLLDAGVSPGQLPTDDVLAVLRMPVRVFVLVLAQFAGGILLAPVIAQTLLPRLLDDGERFVVGAAAYGLVCATVQFYATNNLVLKRIAPVLLVDGTLRHLGRVRVARVWQHLVLLTTTCGLAWPTLLVLMVVLTDRPSAAATALLVLLALASFGFQIHGVLNALSVGADQLADRMQRVGDGDLTARADVRGLDTLSVMASHFNAMVAGLLQREHIKDVLGRYVARQIADEILSGRVELGGELRTATVLFSDIRDFTRTSEERSPIEVLSSLNEYLTEMVDCVIEHDGVVDKFIGDAVMAVFGVPLGAGAQRDAENAVACACAMAERLTSLNARRAGRGQAPLAIGIGIHTGVLVAGNVGSPRRMEYTVIGDTVNVAARLEGMTKEHGCQTLLSATTAALVGGRFPLVALGDAPVRGRAGTLSLFRLEPTAPPPPPPAS